jgi:hypothetical protein
MTTFVTFIIRFVLVLAGLLMAASVAAAGMLLLAVWGVRAGWAKLRGKPVAAFVKRSPAPSRTPRADAVVPVTKKADVTDVEPRMRAQ